MRTLMAMQFENPLASRRPPSSLPDLLLRESVQLRGTRSLQREVAKWGKSDRVYDEMHTSPPVGESALRLHLKHTHFRNFVLVTRHSEVIPLQLRYQNCGLGTESARDLSHLFVVVSVFLVKYINEVAACNVNSLAFGIISQVIDHVPTRKAGNYRAGIRIQNNQPFGIIGGDKKAMSSFIKRHSDIVLPLLPNRPGCNHSVLFPVNDPNRVFAGNIDKHPRSCLLKSQRLYTIGIDFYVGQLLIGGCIHDADQTICHFGALATVNDIQVFCRRIVSHRVRVILQLYSPKTFVGVALIDLDFRRASVNYEELF